MALSPTFPPHVRRHASLLRDERGAVMVEFAIVVMMMAVAIFGAVDWSRYFLLRATLTNAARDAARYGATYYSNNTTNFGSNGTLPSPETEVTGYVNSLLTTAGVTGQTIAVTKGTNTLTVTITTPTGYFVPVTRLVMKANKTLSVSSQFRVENP